MLLPVHAQDGIIISLDAPMQVMVTADARGVLQFENDKPDMVLTIETRALTEDFDTVLWIVDEAMNLLAYNDNTSGGTAAQLPNLVLRKAGVYTIFVDSFNGVSEGEVEVVLREVDRFGTYIEETAATQVITLTLPEDAVFSYPLTVATAHVLTVTAYDGSGRLDPYLRIVDSAGNVVMTNDDHHSSDVSLNIFDAHIAEWEVPADDTYTIEVLDFLGRGGELTLEIQQMR